MKERPILMKAFSVQAILAGRKSQTRRVIKPQPKCPVLRFDERGYLWGDGDGTPIRYKYGQAGDREWQSGMPPADGFYCVETFDKPVYLRRFLSGNSSGLLWGWNETDDPEAIEIEGLTLETIRWKRPSDRLWVKETWSPLSDIELCRREGEPVEIAYRADDGWFENDDARELLNDGKWKPSLFMPRWASRILLEITDIRVERVQNISESDSRAEGLLPCGSFALGADLAKTARQRYSELWNSINMKRGFGWDMNSWVWIVGFKVIDNEA